MGDSTIEMTDDQPAAPPALDGRARGALAGALAAAAALAAPELLAAAVPGAPSLVAAVGTSVIALQPPGAKDFVVGLFGEADKLALEVTIVVVALAVGAVLGLIARRRFGVAAAGFGIAGVVGFAAAVSDPLVSPAIAIVSAGIAVGAGSLVLAWLGSGLAAGRDGVRTSGSAAAGTSMMPDWSRRGFLVRAGAVGVASAFAGVVGRSVLAARAEDVVPVGAYPPATNEAVLPPGAELPVDGITQLVVPNDRFYRIDTALLVPVVDASTWRLRIHNMVERETELTFDELLRLPMIEQYVTIACVSNQVGGRLVGNAKWTGVPLHEVLDLAGVKPGATQLVGRSVDGWTAGMPTAWVTDDSREPLIAVQMNDEPLPAQHGYPARLIVPGLYGYVSATKWLAELELTTLEAFDAYWVPLGWAKEAPILTQSRIDVPRNLMAVSGDPVVLAGVAWAPDRGVSRVEVAVDGEWRDAVMSVPISDATWVQWTYDWAAPPPGRHEIRVRATDGNGQVQTAERTRPDPDGARGHHTIELDVSAA
jgi:DMSO/TMAO reductase YedYZ molybdopterin-dependent catalytic subunit